MAIAGIDVSEAESPDKSLWTETNENEQAITGLSGDVGGSLPDARGSPSVVSANLLRCGRALISMGGQLTWTRCTREYGQTQRTIRQSGVLCFVFRHSPLVCSAAVVSLTMSVKADGSRNCWIQSRRTGIVTQ